LIYSLVLLAAFVAALLNPRATVPASVLAADWVATWGLEALGLYRGIPWIDALAFYGILFPVLRRPKWEGVLTLGLVLVMLLAHLIFWSWWSVGVVYGEEYKFALNYSFLAAVIALSLGGFDAWSFVGACCDGARRVFGDAAGSVAAGKAALVAVAAKEEGR
jgi:hypothetical protein